ncbi:MAG: aldose epimerase family protein [Janthinobacterium lividum]
MTHFGMLPDGTSASLHTLQNDVLRVCVTDYGARMVSIEAPDRDGVRGHVLLGLEDAAAYATSGGWFGAVLGRFANRVGGARFTLDGREHMLPANEGVNTLHGGPHGFGMRTWTVRAAGAAELALELVSEDGDSGYPGTMHVGARYVLRGDTLRLELEARTDAATVVNLSAHPYFNLGGDPRHDVLSHEFEIPAERFVPVDGAQVPTGELRAVAGTPFDFRVARTFADGIYGTDPQLMPGRGYDHCFVVDGEAGAMRVAARVRDPRSGRTLEVRSTQPGVQVYSGNSLTGAVVGRGGVTLRQSSGFALEPENFPDAPNQAGFPSAVLRPGERYFEVIEYGFGVA